MMSNVSVRLIYFVMGDAAEELTQKISLSAGRIFINSLGRMRKIRIRVKLVVSNPTLYFITGTKIPSENLVLSTECSAFVAFLGIQYKDSANTFSSLYTMLSCT